MQDAGESMTAAGFYFPGGFYDKGPVLVSETPIEILSGTRAVETRTAGTGRAQKPSLLRAGLFQEPPWLVVNHLLRGKQSQPGISPQEKLGRGFQGPLYNLSGKMCYIC